MLKMIYPVALSLIIFASCSDNSEKISELQRKVDLLQSKLDSAYTPGFGEMMSNIQIHHAKLWFAGKNQSWKLAEFEIHEIEETVEAILKYQSEREETKSLNVINAPLDNIKNAISEKDFSKFINSYSFLTKTCNTCHEAVKFEFNTVKIPDSPPFSNQEFK